MAEPLYYYQDHEQRTVGPLDLPALAELAERGEIHSATWVIPEGGQEWVAWSDAAPLPPPALEEEMAPEAPRYYYAPDRQPPQGPATFAELRERVARGEIDPAETFVVIEGSQDWQLLAGFEPDGEASVALATEPSPAAPTEEVVPEETAPGDVLLPEDEPAPEALPEPASPLAAGRGRKQAGEIAFPATAARSPDAGRTIIEPSAAPLRRSPWRSRAPWMAGGIALALGLAVAFLYLTPAGRRIAPMLGLHPRGEVVAPEAAPVAEEPAPAVPAIDPDELSHFEGIFEEATPGFIRRSLRLGNGRAELVVPLDAKRFAVYAGSATLVPAKAATRTEAAREPSMALELRGGEFAIETGFAGAVSAQNFSLHYFAAPDGREAPEIAEMKLDHFLMLQSDLSGARALPFVRATSSDADAVLNTLAPAAVQALAAAQKAPDSAATQQAAELQESEDAIHQARFLGMFTGLTPLPGKGSLIPTRLNIELGRLTVTLETAGDSLKWTGAYRVSAEAEGWVRLDITPDPGAPEGKIGLRFRRMDPSADFDYVVLKEGETPYRLQRMKGN